MQLEPAGKRVLRHSGGTSHVACLVGEQAAGGLYKPPQPSKLGYRGP